jgi:hypothetical protein
VPGTATVTVVPEDPAAPPRVYTIAARHLSGDRLLSALGLAVSGGASLAISPSFASALTSYSVSVTHDTTAVTVTATCADPLCSGFTASVASPGPSSSTRISGAVSAALTLGSPGTTVKVYTITVSRAPLPSSDPRLQVLEDSYLLYGTHHDSDVSDYAGPALVLPSADNATVAFRGSCAEAGCTATVSAAPDSASVGTIALPVSGAPGTFSTPAFAITPGATVAFTVTSAAQDTSVPPATYTVSISRPAYPVTPRSTDATLSLVVDGAPLTAGASPAPETVVLIPHAQGQLDFSGTVCAQANCTGWTVLAAGTLATRCRAGPARDSPCRAQCGRGPVVDKRVCARCSAHVGQLDRGVV